MVIQIDLSSDMPIYQQIRTRIVHAVATGELTAGDPLPSVRALARDLGVNMHTVNKAYAVLRDEGYVTMRGRSGAYVADAKNVLSSARALEAQSRIAQEITHLALEFKARGGSREDFVALATHQASLVFSDTKKGDATWPLSLSS